MTDLAGLPPEVASCMWVGEHGVARSERSVEEVAQVEEHDGDDGETGGCLGLETHGVSGGNHGDDVEVHVELDDGGLGDPGVHGASYYDELEGPRLQ